MYQMTLLAMSRDKIKRGGLYQDYSNGGLTDRHRNNHKSVKVSMDSKTIKNGQSNWKFTLEHFLKSSGELQFLLTCNLQHKYIWQTERRINIEILGVKGLSEFRSPENINLSSEKVVEIFF